MGQKVKRKFVTFADSRMKSALSRIEQQAREMDFFDEIEVLNEKMLDAEFVKKNAHLMRPGVRGFGFWVWKPYVIWRALKQLKEGEELYYIDAGCHLNPGGRKRMEDYAVMLRQGDFKMAAFALESDCSEKAFTKMDLLVHMGVEKRADIVESGQLCTGHIFCVKCPEVMQFVEEWQRAWDDIHLIDDSPSIRPNYPEFVEHRHDQSVFSILCKLHGAVALPGNETWPANNSRQWGTMSSYPIWDKRDLGFTMHTLERAARKVRKIWARLRSRIR